MERDNKKTVTIFMFYFFRARLNEGHIANVPSTKSVRRFICCPEFYFSLNCPVTLNFQSCKEPAILLKKRLWHRCFPVKFAKILRTSLLQNTSGRLLLMFRGKRRYAFCSKVHFALSLLLQS